MSEVPTILMCPPDYYGIEYEINPWMSRSRASDTDASREQWHGLRDLLESLGADIRLLDPVRGLPDLVFTANAGLVHQKRVYLSRFRHDARKGTGRVEYREPPHACLLHLFQRPADIVIREAASHVRAHRLMYGDVCRVPLARRRLRHRGT